jgi:hypothetical protein
MDRTDSFPEDLNLESTLGLVGIPLAIYAGGPALADAKQPDNVKPESMVKMTAAELSAVHAQGVPEETIQKLLGSPDAGRLEKLKNFVPIDSQRIDRLTQRLWENVPEQFRDITAQARQRMIESISTRGMDSMRTQDVFSFRTLYNFVKSAEKTVQALSDLNSLRRN